MNKLLKIALAGVAILSPCLKVNAEEQTIRVFEDAKFYDGYLLKNFPSDIPEDDILRHYTYLYAKQLTEEQLNQIGNYLRMDVYVTAACDNYDRIGNINLALVPKGQDTYTVTHDPEQDVARIELGRFITPFMNKNASPKTVPYTYNVSYLSYILRDASLREKYNFWVEFELFGVPYAAQQQIRGCGVRNDVFLGTLDFVTNGGPLEQTNDDVLVPIVIKRPEYMGGNLNNYSESGTDEIGTTVKTYTFTVPENVNESQLVLITSNHGADTEGEEYYRRMHYVYFDDELVLTYVPGRTSCEPFRVYNTQANGIYGTTARTDEEWQSFSNWCPGDVIDNRIILTGNLSAGEHKVKIAVPAAIFYGKKGDIPVSIFFQGLKTGTYADGVEATKFIPNTSYTIDGNTCYVNAGDYELLSIELYNLKGEMLREVLDGNSFSIDNLSKGVYVLLVELTNGSIEIHKIVL
jgi:hypothetical protein